ncbi:MAG: hypothetical protein ISS31_10280 [Kiritimatiellae bacterium]|nr:hypothetical protein [Kiritimatiellia bacterium]
MRKRRLTVPAAVFTLVALSVPSSAATIRVPLDQPTIQEGINAASGGDTVLVAAGTYTGANNRNLGAAGVNIVVMSEAGAAQTIIDCEGGDRAFYLHDGEDSTSVIRGFTITNASGGNGGGIAVIHAAATIEDCIFSNNTASMNGGGVQYGYAATAGAIRNCVFYGNSASYRGGGINCDHGHGENVAPAITGCVFYDNDAGSGGSFGGGGIFCSYSSPLISGCTVVGNAGGPGAGGIDGDGSSPIVRNTIVAFSTEGAGIEGVDADHCIIFGNAGGDLLSGMSRENLNVNPLFCDLVARDLTVCSDSPCVAGDPENPWGEQVGAYGSGCGDCDTPVETGSWGSIKAMYRSP